MRHTLHSAIGILAAGTLLACAMPVNAQDAAFEPIKNTYGNIIPEQGIYTELSEFTLQLSDGYKNDFIEATGSKKVTLIEEETNATVASASVTSGTGKVTIKLDNTITEPGHYILWVPEDALGYDDDTWGWEGIQEMRFRLWVEKNEFEPISNRIATIDPEQGVYTELEAFTITFSSAFAGNYIEGNSSRKINLLDEDTGVSVATASVKAGTAKVTLTLDTKVTTSGHYVLDIPEGALWYDDEEGWGSEDIQALQFRYWITGGDVPPVNAFEPVTNRYGNVTPEQGLYKSLKEITLQLSEAYSSDYIEAGSKKITLVDEDTETIAATLTVKGGYGKVTLSFPDEFSTKGHYLLQVPEGALGYEDDLYEWYDCPEMSFRYWIDPTTGVAEVQGTVVDRADVFSITGIRVLRGATVDDMHSLPAGIYIRNGRKIAIR